MWDASNQLIASTQLTSRAQTALATFINLMQEIRSQIADQDLFQQIEIMLDLSQLIEHFKKEKGEKGQARIENLNELIHAARDFDFEGLEFDESEVDGGEQLLKIRP